MNYKIVFCDLDGTLLNNNHQLSPNNANTIKNLTVPFVIVSARMPKGITCFTDQLQLDYPICAYNGAYIIHQNQIIHNQAIPAGLVREIVAMIEITNAHLSIYQQDQWHIAKEDKYSQNEARITNIAPSIRRFCDLELTNVNKLLVISSLEETDEIIALLDKYATKLTIVKSKPNYIEIMPKNTSKEAAVTAILDYYGLGADQAIAIGDNYNDEPMINAVGKGIFLANAPHDLKSKYDTSVFDNNQDGVSLVLQKLLETKK